MSTGSRSYTIKELENYCGIKAHTIRMWEKRYGILTPERSDTNIRFYTEDELKKIIAISILNHNGIKISHIAKMNDEQMLHAIMKTTSADEEKMGDFKPGQIIMSALRFNEDQFIKALQPYIDNEGFEQAYIRYFYPLMQKARTLWLTDCLSKAQEQFIEHSIRSLIITNYQLLDVPATRETVVIINVTENDPYGTLLFMKFILKKRAFDIVYTDGMLTTSDINGIQLIKPFSVLVLNVSAATPDEEMSELTSLLIKQLKLKKLLFTGRPGHVEGLKDNRTEIAFTPSAFSEWADKL